MDMQAALNQAREELSPRDEQVAARAEQILAEFEARRLADEQRSALEADIQSLQDLLVSKRDQLSQMAQAQG